MTIGSPDWQDVTQPQPVNDILYTGQVPANTTLLNGTLAAAQGVYQYIVIEVTTSSVHTLTVDIYDPNTLQGTIYTRQSASVGTQSFYFPASGFIGSELTFSVQLGSADAINPMPVTVFGLRSWPDGLRFDGLRIPQGMNCAAFSNQSSSSTLVAAPGIEQRLLIADIVMPTAIVASATVGSTELLGSIFGTSEVIANAVYTPNGMTANVGVPNSGILLDADTALTQQSSSAVLTATGVRSGAVFYDVVQ